MRLLLLSLLLIAISGTDGSCTFRSAKWKKVKDDSLREVEPFS